MSKMHWCPYCQKFVTGTTKPYGYYNAPKIHCDSCERVIGTPEKEKV